TYEPNRRLGKFDGTGADPVVAAGPRRTAANCGCRTTRAASATGHRHHHWHGYRATGTGYAGSRYTTDKTTENALPGSGFQSGTQPFSGHGQSVRQADDRSDS